MSLKERIQDDMKAAMRAGEKDRLATIRLLLAAIKQREVDERIALDDTQTLTVIEKMIKQRKESIAQFQAGTVPISWTRNPQRCACCRLTSPRSCRKASSTH